ncbi:hypothetical protein [Mesorhizobium amorphae]|uniref:hypothetical protein n=1 Tax=Mesorhizobium amorphae TaxID=71433 RepID=UPI0011841A68|nr:hypothetical protein [Mesorhizobium amorphae]
MRLLRALRCMAHFRVSHFLLLASEWHFGRAEAILADIRMRRTLDGSRVAPSNHAGRVLLASIVGLAICISWIWFTARAGR